MKIDRTKNASRNIAFGIILKLYQIVCPFIIRTTMIYILGMEYVGLNSLFNSILQVLNLTELGVGTAMVFSMYKPIAEDDQDSICKLMKLYKIYYRGIGIIIAVAGILLTPIVPKLISGEIPLSSNLYYLYWMNLGYTVISYWLFAYKSSILYAHQRTDIVSKVMLFANTCMYAMQLILIVGFKSYYLYLIGMIIGQALTNILTAIVADRMYPQYKPIGKLEKAQIKEINQRVRDLFTSKVGGVIQNSTDSIVISAFLGLNVLAKYNNYYYIINSIFSFMIIFFNAILGGIGNSIILESNKKNYNDLKKIAFITEWLAGFCCCCLLCLYQPFMKIWVGEDNLLSMGIVVCISIYLYILISNQMLCLYKDAAGIWHEDRMRPLITAMVNLGLNLLTVKFLGLYGVVLSTVISMLFIGMPWLISNLFRSVFHQNCSEFVRKMLCYALVSVGISAVTYWICSGIVDKGVVTFIIKLVVCLIVPNVGYLLVYHKYKEFAASVRMADNILGNRLQKIRFIRKFL